MEFGLLYVELAKRPKEISHENQAGVILERKQNFRQEDSKPYCQVNRKPKVI